MLTKLISFSKNVHRVFEGRIELQEFRSGYSLNHCDLINVVQPDTAYTLMVHENILAFDFC